MGEKEELRNRVEAKRKRIEARINELKADSRSEAREELEKLQGKLNSLADSVKEGWHNLSDVAAGKLNDWLKDEND